MIDLPPPADPGPLRPGQGAPPRRRGADLRSAHDRPTTPKPPAPSRRPPPRSAGRSPSSALLALMIGYYGGWIWALAGVIGVFVHEYGHVLAINALGCGPGRIRIIPFVGGAATMQRTPATDFKGVLIALAGPASACSPPSRSSSWRARLATAAGWAALLHRPHQPAQPGPRPAAGRLKGARPGPGAHPSPGRADLAGTGRRYRGDPGGAHRQLDHRRLRRHGYPDRRARPDDASAGAAAERCCSGWRPSRSG